MLSVPVNAMLHDKCTQLSLYGIQKFKFKSLGLQFRSIPNPQVSQRNSDVVHSMDKYVSQPRAFDVKGE